jgi:hypothetical protein
MEIKFRFTDKTRSNQSTGKYVAIKFNVHHKQSQMFLSGDDRNFSRLSALSMTTELRKKEKVHVCLNHREMEKKGN